MRKIQNIPGALGAWVLKTVLSRHAREVAASMQDPLQAQIKTFKRLQKLLKGSELSFLSGFDRCKSLEDCRYLRPTDSVSLKPFLDRAFDRGVAENQILGRSPIIGFGRTSGTEGQPKDIPLNQAYLRSLDRTLLRMAASHLYTTGNWRGFLNGKQITLASRLHLGTSPTGLPISDITGLIQTRAWRILRHLYIPRLKRDEAQDWPTRAEVILKQARGQNVISMIGIPALATDLTKRALAKYDISHLNQVWPRLRFFIYGGIHLSEGQKKQIAETWSDSASALKFIETYVATEGALAFAYDADQEGMALNTLENLYLFRDENEHDAFYFAHELKLGRVYSLHVTTPGGLIHYRIGDRIEAVSTHPLRIRVVGREKDELSMTGEKITLNQIDLAVIAAGLSPFQNAFHWPVVWIENIENENKPRLVWGLPEAAGDVSSYAKKLDEALCKLNTLYAEALVREEVIAGSRLVSIPQSVFEKLLRTKLGVGQFKPKRLFRSESEFAQEYGWSPSGLKSDGQNGS